MEIFSFSKSRVVSYWRKYVHEVLVNRLGGLSLPRKSVVRLTDRPDMTLDVYRGRKTTIQQQQKQSDKVSSHDNMLLFFRREKLAQCKEDKQKREAEGKMKKETDPAAKETKKEGKEGKEKEGKDKEKQGNKTNCKLFFYDVEVHTC